MCDRTTQNAFVRKPDHLTHCKCVDDQALMMPTKRLATSDHLENLKVIRSSFTWLHLFEEIKFWNVQIKSWLFKLFECFKSGVHQQRQYKMDTTSGSVISLVVSLPQSKMRSKNANAARKRRIQWGPFWKMKSSPKKWKTVPTKVLSRWAFRTNNEIVRQIAIQIAASNGEDALKRDQC